MQNFRLSMILGGVRRTVPGTHRSHSLTASSRARAIVLTASVTALSAGALLLGSLYLAYANPFGLLTNSVLRSREYFPFEFYMDAYQQQILLASLYIGLLGGWLSSHRLAGDQPTGAGQFWSQFLMWVSRSAGPVSIGVVLVLMAIAHWSGIYFETNDDAIFHAIFQQAVGGDQIAQTGFVGSPLAATVSALYRRAPDVIWWGFVLWGFQGLANIVLLRGILQGSSRWPFGAGMGTVFVLLAFFSYSLRFVQFNHVAISLGAAGLWLMVPSRPDGRDGTIPRVRTDVVRPLLGAACILVAAQFRFEGAVLGALIVAVVTLGMGFLGLNGVRRRKFLTALLVAAGAGLLLVTDAGLPGGFVEEPWVGELHPESACIGQQQNDAWQGLAAARFGPLSQNDARFIGSWIFPTGALFGQEESHIRGRAPDVRCWISARSGWSGNSSRFVILGMVLALLLSLTAPVGNHQSLRRFAMGLVMLFPVFLVVGLDLVLRAPTRIAFPSVVIGMVASMTAVNSVEAPTSHGVVKTGSVLRTTLASLLVLHLVLLAPLIAVLTVQEREEQLHRDRREQTLFLSMVSALPRAGGPVVVVSWLDPMLESLQITSPALSFPQDVELVRVSGWNTALPAHRRALVERELEDWVAIVAEDRNVYLGVNKRRVEVLLKLLEERRGVDCATPDIVASAGQWVLVRSVASQCD